MLHVSYIIWSLFLPLRNINMTYFLIPDGVVGAGKGQELPLLP